MFEKELAEKFQTIFGFKKVTFERPSESNEQEVVFIDVVNPVIRIRDGIQQARVQGRASVFVRGAKMPFGYFQKCLELADPKVLKGLVLFQIDTNAKTYFDLVERSFEFTYFYSSQYDPEIGTLNQVTFEV